MYQSFLPWLQQRGWKSLSLSLLVLVGIPFACIHVIDFSASPDSAKLWKILLKSPFYYLAMACLSFSQSSLSFVRQSSGKERSASNIGLLADAHQIKKFEQAHPDSKVTLLYKLKYAAILFMLLAVIQCWVTWK